MEDPQIAELKELVRQNIAISQDTSKMVRKMRSAGRLKSLFWLLILILSIGSSIYTYYYFIEPRVTEIKNVYEKNIAPLQGASSNINNFLKQFGQATTTAKQ